jgi:hypothetical protein
LARSDIDSLNQIVTNVSEGIELSNQKVIFGRPSPIRVQRELREPLATIIAHHEFCFCCGWVSVGRLWDGSVPA